MGEEKRGVWGKGGLRRERREEKLVKTRGKEGRKGKGEKSGSKEGARCEKSKLERRMK